VNAISVPLLRITTHLVWHGLILIVRRVLGPWRRQLLLQLLLLQLLLLLLGRLYVFKAICTCEAKILVQKAVCKFTKSNQLTGNKKFK
jgi:hypothetical protein